MMYGLRDQRNDAIFSLVFIFCKRLGISVLPGMGVPYLQDGAGVS